MKRYGTSTLPEIDIASENPMVGKLTSPVGYSRFFCGAYVSFRRVHLAREVISQDTFRRSLVVHEGTSQVHS